MRGVCPGSLPPEPTATEPVGLRWSTGEGSPSEFLLAKRFDRHSATFVSATAASVKVCVRRRHRLARPTTFMGPASANLHTTGIHAPLRCMATWELLAVRPGYLREGRHGGRPTRDAKSSL